MTRKLRSRPAGRGRGVRTGRALALALICAAWPAAAQQPDPRMIQVSAVGEVKVTPDEIRLVLGVETYGKTLDEAKKQADERVRRVLKACDQEQVKPEDVRTSHMNITPRYEFRDQMRFDRLVGFTCNRKIDIVLRQPDRLDALLAAALADGANQVLHVVATVAQLASSEERARREALLSARSKAEQMAAVLGQTLGPPRRIVEQSSGLASGGQDGPMYVTATASHPRSPEGAHYAAPTFALGQATVVVRVEVEFALQ